MSTMNIFRELTNSKFPSSFKGISTAEGFMVGYGTGDPVAADDYAPGAAFLRTDTTLLLVNTGTKASPTWTDQKA